MKASKKIAHHRIAPILAGVDAAFLKAALARERRYRGLVVTKQARLDPEVTAAAKACFGAAVGAAEWLATPAHGLAGKIPLKVAQTARGRERVLTLLHRIDHNIL